MTLLDELRQTKPFPTIEQEAILGIVRTSALIMDAFETMLRPYEITATQYNVLRILRGSEPDGLCRNDLRDRMLTRMPDVTRLLDRMAAAGLVERTRDSKDKRLVSSRITSKGLQLLSRLDNIVTADQKRRFEGVGEKQIQSLIDVLTIVRQV